MDLLHRDLLHRACTALRRLGASRGPRAGPRGTPRGTPPGGPRLDPVGRRWRRRRGPLLRLAAVAALLAAAVTLYTGGLSSGSAPTEHRAAPTPSPATASAQPSDAGSARAPGFPDPDTTGPDTTGPGTGGPDTPDGAVTVAGADAGVRHPVPAGRVGVPVRLADPTRLAGVALGDRVDLYAAGSRPATEAVPTPEPIAEDAPVLAVDRGAAALQLALTREIAQAIVAAPPGTSYAVLVRP